jgi:hemoglobin
MSLYQQLGGEPAIDAVVEKFYDIMLLDTRVNYLFKNTDMKRQRLMQKKFLNHVLGGAPYDGKNMKEAHKKLKLTDQHFDAVGENLAAAMKSLSVKQDLIDQVIAIAETTRNDVLGRDVSFCAKYWIPVSVAVVAVILGFALIRRK